MSNKNNFSQINGFNEAETSPAFIEAMLEVKEELDKIRLLIIKAQGEVLYTNFHELFKDYFKEIKRLLRKTVENINKAQKLNTSKPKATYH